MATRHYGRTLKVRLTPNKFNLTQSLTLTLKSIVDKYKPNIRRKKSTGWTRHLTDVSPLPDQLKFDLKTTIFKKKKTTKKDHGA